MRHVDAILPLGELLIQQGAITRIQLNEALAMQERRGGKLAEILIKLRHIDAAKLGHILSTHPGIATVDLARHELSRDLCGLIPEEFAVANQVFPIDKMGKTLTVGMAFPLDKATIAAIAEMTDLRVNAFYCNPDAIRAAVERYYRAEGDVSWAKVMETTNQKRTRPGG
jgi:type IV pilus assembly protein PilB